MGKTWLRMSKCTPPGLFGGLEGLSGPPGLLGPAGQLEPVGLAARPEQLGRTEHSGQLAGRPADRQLAVAWLSNPTGQLAPLTQQESGQFLGPTKVQALDSWQLAGREQPLGPERYCCWHPWLRLTVSAAAQATSWQLRQLLHSFSEMLRLTAVAAGCSAELPGATAVGKWNWLSWQLRQLSPCSACRGRC